jgi:hypothetical protein
VNYLVATIGLLLFGWYIHWTSLSTEIVELKSALQYANTNKILCDEALDSQTKLIEAQRVDYEAKMLEYNQSTPQVRYKVIYNDIIKEVNITKEDSNCEDIKQVISNIRNIDINSL